MLAQADAATLGSKYGEPIKRETFQVRPHLQMVVSYGPAGQVCRLQFPPAYQVGGADSSDLVAKQQVDEVVAEVVPPAVRGKELGRYQTQLGLVTITTIDYEHLSISTLLQPGDAIRVAVVFKDEACRTVSPASSKPADSKPANSVHDRNPLPYARLVIDSAPRVGTY